MRDLFVEDGLDMPQGTLTSGADAAQEIREELGGQYVCPFCGVVKDRTDGLCPRCTIENTAASRQATKSRIGPWYVLQNRNPAAPGMKFDTLLAFVRKGRVKARTIVRGPTTHQLWRFAAHVKGLSREFGICHSCGGGVDRGARLCPHCNRPQEPPENPDAFLEGQEDLPPGPIPIFRDIGGRPPAEAEEVAAPPAREPPRKGDGFLSAQDLAAAFKLDFKPRGHKGVRAEEAPQAAPQRQRRPNARRALRRRPRWGRWVLLLLLVGVSGAFVVAYARDSAFRTKSRGWFDGTVSWVKQKWTELSARPPRKSQSFHVVPDDGSKPTDQMSVERSTADASSTTPSAQPPPGAASQPSEWDKIFDRKPSADPANAQPAKRHRGGTFDDVRELYRGAIDAEAHQDYSTAVKKYEQIREFSRDLWPRDLELRLKEARQAVGQ